MIIETPHISVRLHDRQHLLAICRGRENDWLAPGERAAMSCTANLARRESHLLGRVLVKQLLLEAIAAARFVSAATRPDQIEIVSRDRAGRAVRPRATVCGCPRSWPISISHSRRSVLAAVATQRGALVGVDLVELEPDCTTFTSAWFTDREQAWLDEQRDRQAAAVLWGVKEAVFKAYGDGERFAPRQIEVLPLAEGQFQCRFYGVPLAPGAQFEVRWCGGQAAVIVHQPPETGQHAAGLNAGAGATAGAGRAIAANPAVDVRRWVAACPADHANPAVGAGPALAASRATPDVEVWAGAAPLPIACM